MNYYILHSHSGRTSFLDQLTDVKHQLASLTTVSFIRVFLSDVPGQYRETAEAFDSFDCPVSIIGQPPLDGSKIAALVITGHSPFVYTVNNTSSQEGTYAQTRELLHDYVTTLEQSGTTLNHCLRTWFFVDDIDNNYHGMVEARNDVFAENNLTKDSHFIASTGIQGRPINIKSLVQMDAVSLKQPWNNPGTTLEQPCNNHVTTLEQPFHYLKGSSHLNPTHEYGVAFERGSYIDLPDHRHVFISGTASINNRGEVLFVGDVRRQTMRMLENVEVLLHEAGCSFSDVPYILVYIRNVSDYQVVNGIFKERFPHTPYIVLHAPVCRPAWLIEMECEAEKTLQ